MIRQTVRSAPIPRTLEERIRAAYISEYVMARRWRKDAADDLSRLNYEERKRLDEFKARVANYRHFHTALTGQDRCYVCDLTVEEHDEIIEPLASPPHGSVYSSQTEYERHLLSVYRRDVFVADIVAETARHFQDVYRNGGW